MRVELEPKLDFNDVLLRPMTSVLTSRADVDLNRKFDFKWSGRSWEGVPIVASNMDSIGTMEMAKVLSKYKMLTALHKFYTVEQLKEFVYSSKVPPEYVMLSTGIRNEDLEKLKEIKKQKIDVGFDFICLDVPNGYIQVFSEKAKMVREMFPEHTIMAGNVVTSDITEHLIQNVGMDIVKVGIGPGKACTTRNLTGVGYPQLSAVMETSNAAHGVKGWICSDGGCRTPGDVSKAICGGADFIMLGFMLAGHDECGGEIVVQNDTTKMKFYGMSSKEAMTKHYGGVAKHRAPEGRTLMVDYKGPVEQTVLEILGGVRSCATYIGAEKMKEMHKRATFVRVK